LRARALSDRLGVSIFITHHHADHNIEYGPMLVVGWVNGMHLDVRAFGPPPLKLMTEDFMRAYKTTVDFWAEDFKMKPLVAVDVTEVSAGLRDHRRAPASETGAGLPFRLQGPLDCFLGRYCAARSGGENGHGRRCLGARGDVCARVGELYRDEIAKGRPVKFEDVMAHMKADHTPVEDVGRIAQEAGVKTLVLSHLVPATDGITDDTWRAAAAKYFKGEIIVGKDLMVV
jgi:ribonuclease BN (tRNA processing enzyme)